MATPSLPPSSLVSPLPSLSPIFYPLLAPRPAASKQQLIQKWPGRPPSDVRPSSECLFVGCVCSLARSFPLFLPSPKRANDPASLNRNTASSTGGRGLHLLAYRRKRNRLTPRSESRWDAAAAAAAGFSRGRDGRYPRPWPRRAPRPWRHKMAKGWPIRSSTSEMASACGINPHPHHPSRDF